MLLRRGNDVDFHIDARNAYKQAVDWGFVDTFRKLHPILKEQHFLNPREEEDDPYESTQVTALVAVPPGVEKDGWIGQSLLA